MIPYTTDADLGIWDYEYEDKIMETFRKSVDLRLGLRLGFRKEAF